MVSFMNNEKIFCWLSKKYFILIFSCLTLVGCGYRLLGTGSFPFPNIKIINIPLFKNYTTRFELDLKLTQGVINEFVKRGKVQVSQDAKTADAVLSGEILSFHVTPIAFSGQATADNYNIIIVTKIELKELATERVIYSNPSFVYQQEYKVPPDKDFESSQTEALGKIAELFARSLVMTILEGF